MKRQQIKFRHIIRDISLLLAIISILLFFIYGVFFKSLSKEIGVFSFYGMWIFTFLWAFFGWPDFVRNINEA